MAYGSGTSMYVGPPNGCRWMTPNMLLFMAKCATGISPVRLLVEWLHGSFVIITTYRHLLSLEKLCLKILNLLRLFFQLSLTLLSTFLHSRPFSWCLLCTNHLMSLLPTFKWEELELQFVTVHGVGLSSVFYTYCLGLFRSCIVSCLNLVHVANLSGNDMAYVPKSYALPAHIVDLFHMAKFCIAALPSKLLSSNSW